MNPMTNKGLSPNEAIIDTIALFDARCSGCQKTGTDFMLSAVVGKDPRRGDNSTFRLFLSRAQVETLHAQIGALLGKVERGPTT